MSQLTLRNSFSIPVGQEMDQIISVCKVLATCPYYQKLGPGGVLAIYLTAREMNLPLMMCLNGGMYTFSGLVSLSAQLMNMLIVNAGHRADVLHLDEKGCKIRFWRSDRPKDNCTFEYEYTIEMAAKAGYLGKDNWKKSPKDMTFSRCLSGGARKFMPDVIMNAYAIGELGEEDGAIPTAMPDLSTRSIEVSKPQEEPLKEAPKAIENEKVEGYEDFCQKHLCEDEKVAYVRKIAQATNKTEAQIINSAVSNEAGFLTAFNKWKTDQQNVEKRTKSKVGAQSPTNTPSLPLESLVASA
jgi:hypothetical protein